MKLVESVSEMQRIATVARSEGKTIGFVPTMGYLHDGHASLMIECRKHCDLLVTSIFVNPTQFGAGEDLDKYPRDLDRDMSVSSAAGVDIIFAPTARDMYPAGYQTYVNVETLSLPLCGGRRPGHFRGVTTVVAKLFAIVQPTLAYFGRKDFQQLAVIRQMGADLNLPVIIIGMPIVREHDGLAMSSRNAYLTPSERQDALCVVSSLKKVKSLYRQGVTAAEALREAAQQLITAVPSARIDYIELCNSTTLAPVTVVDDVTLMALAVFVGKTRLIDNAVLGEERL